MAKKQPRLWLDRTLIRGSHIALVCSEAEFVKATKRMSLPKGTDWIKDGCRASVSTWRNADGGVASIVSFMPEKGLSGIEIATTLVHEAVHVFQHHCGVISEDDPSKEFEAYSIEAISRELMEAYAARL